MGSGIIMGVAFMGVAFLGYVLPYGQMSYWRATVIINLLSVVSYWVCVVLWGGFVVLVCVFSNTLGDAENFIHANSMVTPIHIKPEWYFLFAYAILRCIPDKTTGVLALAAS